MGLNISGLLIKQKIADIKQLEELLGSSLEFMEEVGFEEAASGMRESGTIDVLQTDTGTLVLTEMGDLFMLDDFGTDVIQFIISDVSGTYYFEKYSGGQLVRKLITTEGEIAEEFGEGIVSENDDFEEKVMEYADSYLQNDFSKKLEEMKFSRYTIS